MYARRIHELGRTDSLQPAMHTGLSRSRGSLHGHRRGVEPAEFARMVRV